MTQTIVYFEDENGIVAGYPLQMPFLVSQANSKEELETSIRKLMSLFGDSLKDMASREDGIKLNKEENGEKWIYGYDVYKLKEELNMYKKIYGDL